MPNHASVLRLGTRGSALALAQARSVAEVLRASGRDVELVEITTAGDVSRAPVESIGGTGIFVTAVREALLDGRVDFAVHSLKDLPTATPDGIVMAAVPPREDPRDVLCARDGRKLADLPSGALIGTGSPRREAQIRSLGLAVEVVGVRGNVDTRLSKVAEGFLDAVVVARAGLIRLGRLDAVTEVLDPQQVLPAPGQGALAVECRASDIELTNLLASVDDPASRAAVTAERTLLAVLEAGCTAPVGAYAEPVPSDVGRGLHIRAVVASRDGSLIIRKSAKGPIESAEELGRGLAAELLANGAEAVVDAGRPAS